MTPHEYRVHAAQFFHDCLTFTDKKNLDYSPDDIFLAEVVDTAFDLHITVPQALAVLLRKHWSAVTTHIRGERPLADEKVSERLRDAANYLSFLDIWEHQRNAIIVAMHSLVKARTCECEIKNFDYPPRPPKDCDRCKFLSHLITLRS